MFMVCGHAISSTFNDYKNNRETASLKLGEAIKQVKVDLSSILKANEAFAIQMVGDQSLMGPFARGDKTAFGTALKDVVLKTGFSGYVTIIDEKGKVFYSSDSPKQSGYDARANSPGVDFVFRNNKSYGGAASFTQPGTLGLSSMVPIRLGNRVAGVMIASQTLNTEFLTGMTTKLQTMDPARLAGIDLALVACNSKATKGGQLIAVSPGLVKKSTPFLKNLEEHGIKALPSKSGPLAQFANANAGFEESGRLWRELKVEDLNENQSIAVILATTPVADLVQRAINVSILAASCGALAFLVALLFSAGISKGVNKPLRFLIRRTNELASQRQVLPALEGLSGDWLELGELIDTSVVSMRQTVSNLKPQIQRQAEEVEAQNRSLDAANQQVETLNRQYSTQAKQLSEVSKQINFANRQAVILQHKLDCILQVSTEGFLILDQFGNVISANPVFLHWMGVTEAEIAGRLCFDLVRRPGETRNSQSQGEVFATHGGDPNALINQFYPEGVVFHRWENKQVEVLAHLQPIVSDDNSIQGYVMVLRDKSVRNENTQLKTEIVAMLNDNIRATLVAGEERWNVILSNAAQSMHPSVGQTLAELHVHYEQLLAVVDSLLMMYGGFVPPPAVQMQREQIMVTRVIAECLEESAPLARDRQLALDYKSVPGLPNISGNKETFKAILLPMLEKMITITAPGGRVRVEAQSKGSELRIGVSSSGPSLPEEEIADVFSGFIQGKHSEDTYSSRLSMYLARNNVERVGGRAWAESGAGRGTIVYFSLPLG